MRTTASSALVALSLAAAAPMAGAQSASAPARQESTPVQLVDALNGVFGQHAGARAVHAKGIVLEGTFKASATARQVSKAPHLQGGTVPAVVRFSDFAGIPDIPDNHGLASPRGLAVRFNLPGGATTDIVAHSFNGFPSPTADDFRELLIALGTSGANVPKPTPLDRYLETHAAAKTFLTTPKPAPVSYGSLPYFGVNAFKFVNAGGVVTYGRYQFQPVDGEKLLSDEAAAKEPADYLQTEIRKRVARAPVRFKLLLQVADSSDPLNDPSSAWPSKRRLVELGVLTIAKVSADSDAAQKSLLFIPNSLPAGIEVQDPMVNARSAAYPVSFGRRQQ